MSAPNDLFSETILLLGGAVVAAPIFKKLGLGTVLGYLAAGIVIGPVFHGITDGEQILAVAELGVVFLLFIIGLELKPSRLWQMRRDIFGLGTAQVMVTGLALTALAWFSHVLDWRGSIVAGFGLALSSTAFAMQILEGDGDVNTRYGQRSFSMLLFQDLAIVPLLALITVLDGNGKGSSTPLTDFAVAVGAVAAMIVAGRYLLTPLFQIIARTGAREAMIAAALFVVMGSASLMQLAGLSMAMGAFLSGVMLAESSYRHELEADIEPFRGVLLAIFFIAVGLSLELGVLLDNALFVIVAVPIVMAIKAIIIYGLCRISGSPHNDAIRIAFLLPQGGEFGFVLFTTAGVVGLMSTSTASLLVAIVTLSMALTPIGAALSKRLLNGDEQEELDEDFEGAGADVLMVGFSRFGQIAAQILLAGGRSVTVIDFSADRIRQASSFGFRIYFGDGTRKDVLRSAGIDRAKIVLVCTQKKEITDKVVELVQADYPHTRLYVRSYDRIHSIELRNKGVDYELRETLESGLLFGRRTLEALGVSEVDAYEIGEDIRKRDEARLALQVSEGLQAGRDMLFSHPVRPEPLVKPKRAADPFEDDPLAGTADATADA
ncbi:monovalent cation:proton antiporter-2 (CPA2) family protein [Rhizobium lentis]|uniref:Potassium transporter TrkA n=1 Tax=Rhizobium lentis TaxID=1138194 RepID=A0ABS7IFV2_9HYPH|nr:monovalent cation:proton antiporter-2 (CPA2) family protein [Rhizobium lentis]MBX4954680.1 potassium transporter TrkA [Rhizobium lentis]MBX4976582.1 potassium transporter TrkA [Rhizobium lentis]MBX4985785.1 potassium transporter TrkA [Rhizobium lentis]MBX5004229.1 potassium transporter TrkA [Rhizobium lentis]MBX5028051.1 potassium transporter TrkA [Rhizobium lentis]